MMYTARIQKGRVYLYENEKRVAWFYGSDNGIWRGALVAALLNATEHIPCLEDLSDWLRKRITNDYLAFQLWRAFAKIDEAGINEAMTQNDRLKQLIAENLMAKETLAANE